MNINSNKILEFLYPFIIISSISYLLCTILFIYLPKTKIEYISGDISSIDFTKYNFMDAFGLIKVKEKEIIKKVEPIVSKPSKPRYRILDKITLQAIFSKGNDDGIIVIEEKSTSKTHMLKKGDGFKEFILTRIENIYAIFSKDGKDYKFHIDREGEELEYEIINKVNKRTSEWEEKVKVTGSSVKVTRKYLNSYVKNIDKVWKNIAIREVMTDGKISGFKVTKVNSKSVFAVLGLKKNDIIKKVNNKSLTNYNEAFKIYNNIDKINYFNILIIRDNKEMELSYDID
jgi:type II secretion system protein C